MRAPIEYFRYTLEIFLASCVPDLKFDADIFYFEQKRTKFNADGDFMVINKLI